MAESAKDHFDPLPHTLPDTLYDALMAQNRIVVARPPTRSRPKKAEPAALALTGPRIVVAQKPGRKRYTAPAPEGDQEKASSDIREWLERAKWGRGPTQ